MSQVNEKNPVEYYLRKKPDIDEMIIDEVVDNGIAFIPCKVSGMDDIISKFSIKNHETLDEEFACYIRSYADDIPAKYPIALAICGHKFTNDEQKVIAETIKDYFTYELGLIRRDNKKNLITFIVMTIVMILSGLLIQNLKVNATFLEYIYVLFWIGADISMAFLLFDGRADRKRRILASRLSSLYIYFDETYDESELSDEEAAYIKKEVFSNENKK